MDSEPTVRLVTRRELLRAAGALAGGAVLARLVPNALGPIPSAYAKQAGAQDDPVAAFRAQLASAPIEAQELTDRIVLLSGPGGNVVVLHGPDGKWVVDTFVSPAWPKLEAALGGLGEAPVRFAIDTHWHFDHTDNNAALHATGATVLAHENTKRRMAEPHDLPILGLRFPPSPAADLPQQTFKNRYRLRANGENVALTHVPPAHTDTDIFVHFEESNVVHAGDVFFNGIYPYIDGSTGGSISGMIAGVNEILALADSSTKIVPGHGPLGNRADVARFLEMLSTARDRVQKLKSSGKSMEEAVAAKPFADLEPTWGKGLFNGDTFVQIVYVTL